MLLPVITMVLPSQVDRCAECIDHCCAPTLQDEFGAPPKDVAAQLKKDTEFWKMLGSAVWKERKEALATLKKALSYPAITPKGEWADVNTCVCDSLAPQLPRALCVIHASASQSMQQDTCLLRATGSNALSL